MTTPAEEPWAAMRDAAWYARPDVRTTKVVHMAGRGSWSRCGRSFLNDDLIWAPEGVPLDLRCQSNGCRQAWPREG